MTPIPYHEVLSELGALQTVGACFLRRQPEPNTIAYDEEAHRYTLGTSYARNSDYALFALEVQTLFGLRGKDVIELCSGPGHLARQLAEAGARQVVGVDGSAAMIDHARRAGGANVTFAHHDVLDGAGDVGQADVVVCQNSLHHFPCESLAEVLRQALGFVRPGGVLYIADYTREALDPAMLSLRLEGTDPHVRQDLLNSIRASFTRLELHLALAELPGVAEFSVERASGVHGRLRLDPRYQQLVRRDPIPHHLDYELSLRLCARRGAAAAPVVDSS